MKITGFRAENFKKLRLVEIEPGVGELVQITGRNASGKSSVLDAVEATLAGAKALPDHPVRRGEERGSILLTLDNGMRIERQFNGTKTTLVVKSEEGLRYSSPQQVLDGLFERIALDPLAFLGASADKQRELFADACGITAELTAINEEFEQAYIARRDANRILRDRKSNLKAEPEWDAAVPADEIPPAPEATRDLQAATQELANYDEYKQTLQHATKWQIDLASEREDLLRRLEEIDKAATAHAQRAKLAAQETANIDRDALVATIDACQKRLELVGYKERHDAATEAARASQAALAEAEREAEIEDQRVARLAREQADLIAESSPIEGLSLDRSDQLIWNGLPLSQASQAERVMISCQMAIAADAKLKVLLVRDGNLLDASMLEQLCETARENDMQVWIELVADEGEVGIYLEDGEVVDA